MAQQSRDTLKGYFQKGKFPTQEQFAALIESLLHYQDQIPAEQIEQLSELLASKAEAQTVVSQQEVLNILNNIPVLMQADKDHFLLSTATILSSTAGFYSVGQVVQGILTPENPDVHPVSVSMRIAELDPSRGNTVKLITLPDTIFDMDVKGNFAATSINGSNLRARIATKYATGQQVIQGLLKYTPDSDPLVQASRIRGYIDQIIRAILPVNTSNIATGAVTGVKINNAAITGGAGISVTIDDNGNFIISTADTAIVQLHVTLNDKLINVSAILSSQGLADRQLSIVNGSTIFDIVKNTDYTLAFTTYDTENEATYRYKVVGYTVNTLDNTAVITINLLTDAAKEQVSPVFDNDFVNNFSAGSAAANAIGDNIFTGYAASDIQTTNLGTMPSYYNSNNRGRETFIKFSETDTEVTGAKFPNAMPASGTLCYLRFTMDKATHQITSMTEIDTGVVPYNFTGSIGNWWNYQSVVHIAANKYVYNVLHLYAVIAVLIDFDTDTCEELYAANINAARNAAQTVRAALGLTGNPYSVASYCSTYYDNNTLYTLVQAQKASGDNTHHFIKFTYNMSTGALSANVIASIPFTSGANIDVMTAVGNWDMALRDGKMLVVSCLGYNSGSLRFAAVDLANNRWVVSSTNMPANNTQAFKTGFATSLYKEVNGKDYILLTGYALYAYEIDWNSHTASTIPIASMLPNNNQYTSQNYATSYYIGCGLLLTVRTTGTRAQIIDIIGGQTLEKTTNSINYLENSPAYLKNGEALYLVRDSSGYPHIYITPDSIDPAWAALYIGDKTF